MDPINYITAVRDPITAALEGYGARLAQQNADRQMGQTDAQLGMQQQGLDLQAQRLGMEQQQFAAAQVQADAQAQAQAQAAAGQQAFAEYTMDPSKTYDKTMAVIKANPALAAQVSEVWAGYSDERKAADTGFTMQFINAAQSGNVDIAEKMLEAKVKAAKNSGDQEAADTYQSYLDMMRTGPDGVKAVVASTMVGLSAVLPPEDAMKFSDRVFGVPQGVDVQSSEIFADGTSIMVMKDGSTRVKNSEGVVVEGKAAADAIKAAQDYGVAVTGRGAGSRTAMSLGAKTAGDALAATQKIFTTISNIDRAIALVRDEGANSGVIQSRLPDWNAATIELSNLKNQLGLDVINSATFGALSEKELAMALDTAIPLKLDGPDLLAWLERKKAAQTKLAQYMKRQALFLAGGDRDVGDWLRAEDARLAADAEAATAQPQATAPESETDEAFLDALEAQVATGKPPTPEQMKRYNAILQGGGQ